MLELEVERQPQKAERLGLEKVFSILVNDYGEQLLPILVKLLDNKDKQVRFVAIENLGRFKGQETNLVRANFLYEVVGIGLLTFPPVCFYNNRGHS